MMVLSFLAHLAIGALVGMVGALVLGVLVDITRPRFIRRVASLHRPVAALMPPPTTSYARLLGAVHVLSQRAPEKDKAHVERLRETLLEAAKLRGVDMPRPIVNVFLPSLRADVAMVRGDCDELPAFVRQQLRPVVRQLGRRLGRLLQRPWALERRQRSAA